MIYQMTIYYGAILNNEVIYSLESNLEDCKTLPSEIDEYAFKYPLEQAILGDELNPNDFEIGYLTKEQYENRFDIENEKAITWTIKNQEE